LPALDIRLVGVPVVEIVVNMVTGSVVRDGSGVEYGSGGIRTESCPAINRRVEDLHVMLHLGVVLWITVVPKNVRLGCDDGTAGRSDSDRWGFVVLYI